MREVETALARNIQHRDAFLSGILLQIPRIEDSTVKTIQTNGKTVKFNPDYIRERIELANGTMEFLQTTLEHEACHIKDKHCLRRGSRDPDTWNRACDYVVNDLLRKAGRKISPTSLLDPRFTQDMTPEYVYKILWEEREAKLKHQSAPPPPPDPDQEQQEGDPGDGAETDSDQDTGDQEPEDGTGENDPGDPDTDETEGDEQEGDSSDTGDQAGDITDNYQTGDEADDDQAATGDQEDEGDTGEDQFTDIGDVEDYPEDGTDAEAETEQVIAQALMIARGQGDKDSVFKALAIEARKPKVDWRAAILQWANSKCSSDWSWNRPNRNYVYQDLYAPSMSKPSPRTLAVFVDVSWSTLETWVHQFISEAGEIMRVFPGSEMHLIFCSNKIKDYKVLTVADLPYSDPVPIGGGTNFAPPFEAIDEAGIILDCCIYLTDLECDQYPEPPPYPVLWCKTKIKGNGYDYGTTPPFGDVIEVEVELY